MGIGVDKSEDPAVFTAENLAKYRIVVLNSSTEMGKLLSVDQRSALMAFIRTKGVVAWHASGDVKGTWPEYTTYLGGELSSHGAGIGTVRRDKGPIAAGLPMSDDTARFDEEWYAYKTNPRTTPNVTVLYTLDEASCKTPCSPEMGDHPIVWVRNEPTGGRFFYSGMGHMDHIFSKDAYTRNLYRKALEWAADAGASPIRPPAPKASAWDGFAAATSGSDLEVRFAGPGVYAFSIGGLDGRVLAAKAGSGPGVYRFPLPASSPVVLSTRTAAGAQVRILR
jgi:type 1 glutamine amidotransferase